MIRYLLAGVVLLAVGCASQADTVRERAPFDLECEDRLDIKEISNNTYGVRGCKRKATYVCNREMPYTCVLESLDGQPRTK